MYCWMDGWMDGWTDGWMDRQMDGWMDRCIVGWRIDRGMERQINRWIDRWMDGQMDCWMNGWMDDEQIAERKTERHRYEQKYALLSLTCIAEQNQQKKSDLKEDHVDDSLQKFQVKAKLTDDHRSQNSHYIM